MRELDQSFEVKWSLSELEGIVYDFITANKLPPEFDSPATKELGHVSKEDLMKVVHLGKGQQSPLPQMVREYILHDRGNSLYLGRSFGNLPSPVHEGDTIRRLFKFNEDGGEQGPKKNESKN